MLRSGRGRPGRAPGKFLESVSEPRRLGGHCEWQPASESAPRLPLLPVLLLVVTMTDSERRSLRLRTVTRPGRWQVGSGQVRSSREVQGHKTKLEAKKRSTSGAELDKAALGIVFRDSVRRVRVFS